MFCKFYILVIIILVIYDIDYQNIAFDTSIKNKISDIYTPIGFSKDQDFSNFFQYFQKTIKKATPYVFETQGVVFNFASKSLNLMTLDNIIRVFIF